MHGKVRLVAIGGALALAVGLQAPSAEAGQIRILHTFTGGDDGGQSSASIFQDCCGNLYGTTKMGGKFGDGTVFMMVRRAYAHWRFGTLHHFGRGDGGRQPVAGVFAADDGTVLGTTNQGGSGGDGTLGTVFRLTPPPPGRRWSKTIVHNFQGAPTDGAGPQSNLALSPDGALYGTTNGGGTMGHGTVFKLTPPGAGETDWTYETIYNFQGFPDGSGPSGDLAIDGDGALYGTATAGGASFAGIVYQLTPPAMSGSEWTRTILYSFTGPRGANPLGGVIFDPFGSGTLYGTTSGGAFNKGTVFQLAPPPPGKVLWRHRILHEFQGGAEGEKPWGGLAVCLDGNLYGTTVNGGGSANCPSGCGTVFRLKPIGSRWRHQVLHAFTGGADGAAPLSGVLFSHWDGLLYGTTSAGGGGCAEPGGCGTVFATTTIVGSP